MLLVVPNITWKKFEEQALEILKLVYHWQVKKCIPSIGNNVQSNRRMSARRDEHKIAVAQ